MSEPIEVWADGSCFPNPGPGGWGALVIFPTHELELIGGERETTNNRMEMQAAIEGLRSVRERRSSIVVFSDSQYLVLGMTTRRANWEKYGLPEKNRDLWEILAMACEYHEIDWRWVRGHNGVANNERSDLLAGYGRACALGEDGNVGFTEWCKARPPP